MIIALLLIKVGIVIVILLMFYIGIHKNDKRVITMAIIYSIAFAIALLVMGVLGNNKESKPEKSDTVQTTYETTVIDGTEYKLVPSDQ